jgi:hypothetical protein
MEDGGWRTEHTASASYHPIHRQVVYRSTTGIHFQSPRPTTSPLFKVQIEKPSKDSLLDGSSLPKLGSLSSQASGTMNVADSGDDEDTR